MPRRDGVASIPAKPRGRLLTYGGGSGVPPPYKIAPVARTSGLRSIDDLPVGTFVSGVRGLLRLGLRLPRPGRARDRTFRPGSLLTRPLAATDSAGGHGLGGTADEQSADFSFSVSAVTSERTNLRPVRRRTADAFDGVLLADAAALAVLADPGITDPPEALADYLRSLAPETRLFAAIDDSGTVRATSGSGVFGNTASVFFVNTDPAWRGHGSAQAMTAAALRAARSGGAGRASLVATDAGAPIYRRLGFQAAGKMTRFFRHASPSQRP